MKKAFFLVVLGLLVVLLSGCPDSETGYASLRNDGTPYSGTGPYDDPNTTYYDTEDSGNSGQGSEYCGDFEEPCCEWIGTDAFGMLTAGNYCNEDLECRAGICVEGPGYESYDRTAGR